MSNNVSNSNNYSTKTQQTQETQGFEDLNRFHRFNQNGVPTGVYDGRIYKDILSHYKLFVLNKTIYIYDESCGVYKRDDTGTIIPTIIKRYIYTDYINDTPVVKRIYQSFFMDNDLVVTSEEVNKQPKHWIHFKNGFYDPKRNKLIENDPKYNCTVVIPHEYRPNESHTGKHIREWLEFIAPNENDREMLLQYLGYCLTMDTGQQKFLILYGTGGTGKSLLIKLLENMVGDENVSNISLCELSQRFASYGLVDKLVNACADLELQALNDTGTIKKLVGEDTLRVEQKGKDSFSYRNKAKLIFSTNQLPLIKSEQSNGLFRRLIMLEMKNKPTVTIPNYYSILASEIDYLISECMKALTRMYQNTNILVSENSIALVNKLRNESDTVQAFLSDCTKRTECNADRIKRSTLYKTYFAYCADLERQSLKKSNFFKSLEVKGYTRLNSNGGRYFTGLLLTDKGKFYNVEESHTRKFY